MTKGKNILYPKGRMKKIRLFLIVFVLISSLSGKEYVLKFSFPSPIPEKPQKPKIDFQTLVEKTDLPIELRNFRIREEAEKEKRLVLKGLPKHILEKREGCFHPLIQKVPVDLNFKLDFFPKLSSETGGGLEGRIFTLGFSNNDTKLNIFSGFSTSPFPFSVMGGNLEKGNRLSTFYLGLIHKKALLSKNSIGLYNVSFITDFEILRSVKLLFDLNYIHFYSANNIQNYLSPKMEIIYRPSSSWLLKGEFSYQIHSPLFEVDDPLFISYSSNIYFAEPVNSTLLSFLIYRFLFSDLGMGIKFSFNDIEKIFQDFEHRGNGAFQSSLVLSREKGSGINFSVSPGILIPSSLLTTYNFPLSDSVRVTPFIFTFSSLLKGEIEFSGTSFEISYNWSSFPYISLSLKDIYSSKILLVQELPISKFIGGNIAIVLELRNFINFLKPPLTDRYLLILYPQWIRGGVEIGF